MGDPTHLTSGDGLGQTVPSECDAHPLCHVSVGDARATHPVLITDTTWAVATQAPCTKKTQPAP
ncbi:hypothetical protein EBZ35_02625 [bacterium]|nr:hypothetical protein [bacterium]